MPHLWISYVRSRTRTSLSTRLGGRIDEGKVKARRWEWGFGKGQWKRRAKRDARELDMDGSARAIYFLVGAFYRVEYTGSKHTANLLYESIR